MLYTAAHGKLRQEVCKFKGSLGSTASPVRPVLCSKTLSQRKIKGKKRIHIRKK